MSVSLYRQVQRFQVCTRQDFKLKCFIRCFEASPVCLQTVEYYLKFISSMVKNTDIGKTIYVCSICSFPTFGNKPTYLLCDREHLSMFCFVRAIFNKRKQIANCTALWSSSPLSIPRKNWFSDCFKRH